MKKIILTVAAVFAFGFANAQEEAKGEGFSKGDVFISGSVGFGTSKYTQNNNYKEDSFTIAPRAAYFVTENIAVGVGLGYSSSKIQATEASEAAKVDMFSVGAFGRYYFTPASKFSVFGHLGFDYANSKNKATDLKVNAFAVEVAPGVNYFFNKNFAVEATWGVLSYASAKADVEGAEASTNFNLGLNLNDIKLGLIYKF